MDDPFLNITLAGYEIQRCLGRGGMGRVYLARHLSLDRLVAIKVLLPELYSDTSYVERFLHEARAAAQLNHPNIIQVHDANVSEDIYFFVMEFVDGKTLMQLLQEQGVLQEEEVLRLLHQAASGLAYAHGRGVVHRDIKPENLLLAKEGLLKVADLGLAKWKPRDSNISLTTAGAAMGTPYYISPEQIRGERGIDGRADIYSLGMTAYHLLSGRAPFLGRTASEIMAQHLSETPPPLKLLNPGVSDETLNLISNMICREKADRPAEMAAVANRMAEILGTPPTYTPPSGSRVTRAGETPKSAIKKIRFWKWAISLGAGAILLLSLVAILKKGPKPTPEQGASENRVVTTEPPVQQAPTPAEDHAVSSGQPTPEPATVPNQPAPPSTPPTQKEGEGYKETLFSAAQKGDSDALKALLDKGTKVDAKDSNGDTALIIAAKTGQLDTVKFLINRGANLEEKDRDGLTALQDTIAIGQEETASALIDKGANVNVKNSAGDSPLLITIGANQDNLAKELIARGAKVNDKNREGTPALFYALACNDPSIAQALVENGAEINGKDHDGNTPLILASEQGFVDVVRSLLKKDAHLEDRNKEGLTALMSASDGEIADVLLEKGANINSKNKDGLTPLFFAIIGNRPKVVEALLKKGSKVDEWNLEAASAEDDQEVIKLLRDAGCPVNFFSAAALGEIEIVKKMVSQVDINERHLNGKTPLWAAARNGRLQIVQFLLERKADVNLSDDDGISPLKAAQDKGRQDIVDLLKEAGAKDGR